MKKSLQSIKASMGDKGEKFKDLEDTLQYVLAKNTNCNLIISNDKKFYSTDIELLTSDEAIKKLNIKK